MHNIYIDIETIAGPNRPSIEEVMDMAPKNMTKEDTIRKWAEENADSIYRKQALDSMQGEILAVGFTHNDNEPDCHIRTNGTDERALLELVEADLMRIVKTYKGVTPVWVGHNVKGFDLPWMWRKCLKYGLYDLARAIPKGRYTKDIEDTMEMWAIDFKDHVSLSKIAGFFGLNGKTEGLDGSRVYDAYLAGEHDRIAEYCKGDVALTREIHRLISAGM